MKKLVRSALPAIVVAFSFAANAQDQCSAINCDCDNLPNAAWSKACENQEARLIADCVKTNAIEGFCSVHGPNANRLPLELEFKSDKLTVLEEIPKLNNQVAVLYWSIIQDFESLETAAKDSKFEKANLKLDTIEHNIERLFEIQLTVGNSLNADGKSALAQLTWRDYSADTLSFGSDFYIRAESLLNTYDGIADKKEREAARDLGIRLMEVSGRVYEQVGFSYASGMRHKHSAKAWKNAAEASALVMAHTTSNTKQSHKPDYYRFQSAARLHRASYHWVIGSGAGSAEESLADSQKFMDDGSSISSLVEKERQIKESKPSW